MFRVIHNLYWVSGLLIGITFLPLFVFTWWKGKTQAARYFSYHLLCVGIWGISSYVVGITPVASLAYWIWNFAYVTVLFIPPFLLHSISLITKKLFRPLLIFAYGQAIFFSVVTLLGFTFSHTKYMFDAFYYNQGGLLYLFSFLTWLGLVVAAHSLLIYHCLTSYPTRKKGFLLLILAIPFGLGGGLTNFLPGLGISFYPFGNFFIPIYSVIVAKAILQYQFLGIPYVLRKGLIYFILIIIISLSYFLTILILEPLRQQFSTEKTRIPSIISVIILGFIFAPLRLSIESWVDKTFFRTTQQAMAQQNELLRQKAMLAEKFRMVSTITRGIVYEIRNPLTTIKALCSYLPKKIHDIEFLQKSASDIDRQIDRINGLLEQLLKFSVPTELEFKPTIIQDVIDHVLHLLNQELSLKNIHCVTTDMVKEKTLLNIDTVRLEQALYNIIINSVEAMPTGGTITVSTEILAYSDIIESNFNPEVEGFFKIMIEDTGCGIPTENLPFIFDPFYSPSEKKLGLGLSITHKIIKEHGGNIMVKSAIGKGTAFTIELPIVKQRRGG